MTKRDGKKYEQIVSNIYNQFSHTSQVTKNEHIQGLGGIPRQIDVALRNNVVGYDILVIIECKDYSSPVGIEKVDELIGKMEDVGAQGAILVSDSGFTHGALKRAEKHPRIQLCSVVDSTNDSIRSKIHIPLKVTFSNIVRYYTPCFQLIRTERSLKKGKEQFDPKNENDIKEIYSIAEKHVQHYLFIFYTFIKNEGHALPSGPFVWEAEVDSTDDYKLFFKCRLEKSHRTFINENIFAKVTGIYDHKKKSLVEGKLEPFTIDEENVIKSWKEIDPEYTTAGETNHYMRAQFFSFDEIESRTKMILENLKKGHLIDLSNPPNIP